MNAAIAAVVAWVWVAVSVPGGHFGMILLAVPLVLVIGTVWGIWLLMSTLYHLGGGGGRALPDRRTIRSWLVGPVLVVVLLLAMRFNLPLLSRFVISLPAMNAMAQKTAYGAHGAHVAHPRWVGLYPVDQVETFPTGMRFLISGAGFLDAWGFAYSPSIPPPKLGDDEYTHLYGAWYVWFWDPF